MNLDTIYRGYRLHENIGNGEVISVAISGHQGQLICVVDSKDRAEEVIDFWLKAP